ncbi:hypothetical protein [Methylorubrum extorquens]|uniref:hypothetical protein n=1 Tax=Methylorubrum extorquens TaxID=408 RepID=UPI00015904D4|nr:hypothetical protein [Methylorubrum extorquens]ABY31464.1 conserved hypothetical protein [Methylorubrum extorquens PA1]WIU38100.1 hypothetical protein KQ926_15955 [Methylorubrum extorquens]
MLKQLEIDSIQADLEAVRNRLAGRTRQQDPIGFRQFTLRRDELERRLAELLEQAGADQHSKEIGLLFGGSPVFGSRGIDADFASRALGGFQDVITAKFASREGPVGQRGRIRGRDRTHMLVADVARGSFGFVLERLNTADDDAGLGETIDSIVDFIESSFSAPDDDFQNITSDLDKRLLTSIQKFYRLLDTSGATMRVVSGQKQYLMQREDVERARRRIDHVEAVDETRPFKGRLLYIPSSRRFDLYIGGGTVISGTIAGGIINELMTSSGMPKEGIAGTWCVVEIRVRKVTVRGQPASYSYQLVRIISSGGEGPTVL